MGKGKLVAGIILLIIGVGLIPASFGMNNLLEQRMDESATTSLYSIRENFLPLAYTMVYADATPLALLELKATAEPDIPGVVNGSVSYYTIRDIIANLTGYIGGINATDWFFNDPDWTVNTTSNYSIQGISEYSGLVNLSFTSTARTRTINKFKVDAHLGIGVNSYISDYEDAIGDAPAQASLSLALNSTWAQIQLVSDYLTDYMFPQIPTLGGFPFAATPSTAEDFFYLQWVSSAVVPGTWKMDIFGENYETWEYEEYDLDLSEVHALWDTTNTSAPLNAEGIQKWYMSTYNATLAAELPALFGLNQSQYSNLMLYFFLSHAGEEVFGPIYEDLQPMTIRDLAYEKLYLQWANGEIFTEGIAFLNPFYEGFEVSFPPDSTGISPTISSQLWTGSVLHSIRNATFGIHLWYELARASVPDPTLYNELRTEFSLTIAQMDALLDWILEFRPSAINILDEDQELDYHPYFMVELVTTGTYIVAGIVGFIGLIYLLTSLKKTR